MCLAVIAINALPEFPFICLANRDEFHDRPTAPLQPWHGKHGTFWAGKDLQSGGTWLGIGSNAEFALLTNVRNSTLNMPVTAPSRGELVVNAIELGVGPTADDAVNYAGFNLICGNLKTPDMQCMSNQGLKLNNGREFSTQLRPGIHSISNGYLNAPWPKSNMLKAGLQETLDAFKQNPVNTTAFEKDLLALLSSTELAQDSELPSTGVPYQWEKMLSAVKIVSPMYGTRSSAVVLMDRNNTVHFTEITLNPEGCEIGRHRFAIPV